ncbi:MAG TPA: DNA cytosine methyltransferase [Candidatus Omnitrophota bacterium]|nr:DNA cytosine methyltransferase [Candidatus Omnitrophota bacterium]
MAVKILDLFAGAGGLALGLESVKDEQGKSVFETFCAVEIDKYACETLRKNFGEDKVIEGDLTKKSVHEEVINKCRGRVSVVAGGIPCQSFSLIGPRSGFGKNIDKFKEDKRDGLYKEFKKIVQELMPNIVIIENVRGILSKKDANGGKIINLLVSDFEKLGYNFKNEKNGSKYLILNAADFGVPQVRERVILIGIKTRWRNADVPFISPTHFNPLNKEANISKGKSLLPYVTLADAIGDLPKVNAKITYTGLGKSEIEKIKKKNQHIKCGEDKILCDKTTLQAYLKKSTPSGRQYFSFVRPKDYDFYYHHVSRSQQVSDLELFDAMKEGETAKEFQTREPELAKKLIKYDMDTFEDKYRKQRWDAPSTTVFAHLQKDGNRFIHPKQKRTITPREAARIQSFPDDFIFCGPFSMKFKQIGNAVPPLLAMRIAESVYFKFGGKI